jgi:ATP-dependent Clp endopeptidase proteolytic subunit ClpP
MMTTWFDIQAKANDEAEIYLYEEIGGFGVNAKTFIDSVRQMNPKKITLRINSPGGSVFDGLAIYNFLKEKDVTVQIDGLAASIASVIAMAGKEVKIAGNGFLMIHNPWGGAMGDSSEMRQTADLLDKIRDSLIGTYAEKTGKDHEKIKEWMENETWFSAQEAKDNGFVDTITDEMSFSASVRGFQNAPEALKAVSKTAPQAARRAFDKGVRQVEEGLGGDGLEPATVKEARSLKTGEAPSENKIRKAYRWWARNERFLDAEADSPADVSANLWGGAAGRDWFRALYHQLEQQEENMENLLKALLDAGLIQAADVSEETAVAQFTEAFANIKKVAEENILSLTQKLDTATAELTEAKAKLDEQAKTEVIAKVDAAVADGRIKAETKDSWVAQIAADTKALYLLDAIQAPKPGAEPVGAPAAASKTSSDLRAEFDAITDPKKRSTFWSANKAQLLKR